MFILYLQVDDKKTRNKLVYPEHLPLTKIQAGLKSGKYLQVYSGMSLNRTCSQTSTVIKMLILGSTSALPIHKNFILSFAFFNRAHSYWLGYK